MTPLPAVSADDHRRIAALARRIWTEHFTPIIGRAQVRYMLDRFQSAPAIAAQITGEDYRYFLIQHHGANVGYFAVQQRGGEMFLSKLYVLAEHRRCGLGRQAVAFVADEARRRGCGRITLTVNKRNADAIAAYEKLDFRRVDQVAADIGGGFVMDDCVMALRLADAPQS